MNKIGKWTGIALIGASVLVVEGVVLSVGVGAAREFLASPEAHAVGVASRIVGRALLHQAAGGVMRVADNLNVVGLRGAPDVLADAARVLDPDPNLNLVCCDNETESALRQARVMVRQMQCQLRVQRRQFETQARMDEIQAREQARAAQRQIYRVQIQERIQQLREQRDVERIRVIKQTI